ncbi:unannotated protein [freshwater metagenome]|uniref:Unannotated protein n=1 Tax=freshwater metagenome TaxID=449393 RepID=A0A6J7IXK5_9ZZZZ
MNLGSFEVMMWWVEVGLHICIEPSVELCLEVLVEGGIEVTGAGGQGGMCAIQSAPSAGF